MPMTGKQVHAIMLSSTFVYGEQAVMAKYCPKESDTYEILSLLRCRNVEKVFHLPLRKCQMTLDTSRLTKWNRSNQAYQSRKAGKKNSRYKRKNGS